MTSPRTRFGYASFALILAALPGSALAQDATAVANRLQALLAKQGMDVTWTGVSQNGGAIELTGVSLGSAGMTGRTDIGTVTLSGVTEANGGYRIGTMTLPDYNYSQEGLNVQVASITATGLSVPGEGSTDPLASVMVYENLAVPSVSVKMAEKELFALTGLNFAIDPVESGKPLSFEGAADKFTADFSTLPDATSKAVLDALGYTTMTGFFKMAGTYQPTDGRLTLSQYDTTVENAGTLGFTFDLGGYTPAFMQTMQEMQKKMAAKPAGGDNSAEGLAMLGLMQQLTFHGATLRFDDKSLTGKVLDYVAKQQGVTAKDIANQAKAIAPFMLGQLNNPELTASASAALAKFLDDPKSLQITAAPAAPVPFAQIAAGAMSAPQELPKTLGLTVTGNE